MPAIFRTKLYQQEQSIKMDNIASAAPMVGVVALAAAFLQGTYSELATTFRRIIMEIFSTVVSSTTF